MDWELIVQVPRLQVLLLEGAQAGRARGLTQPEACPGQPGCILGAQRGSALLNVFVGCLIQAKLSRATAAQHIHVLQLLQYC